MSRCQLIVLAFLVFWAAGPPVDARAPGAGADPAKDAWSLRKQATELRKRGRPDESIAALERAVMLAEGAPRFDRRRLADIHSDLGQAYFERWQRLKPGGYPDALRVATHFERTLALWENTGVNEIRRAIARLNLGHVYNRVGRFDEARALFELALPHIERQFGKDSAQVASLLGGLGMAYHRVHRFGDSERAYSRAIAIYRTKPQHRRDVVGAMHLLGQMYWSSDAYDRAVETLNESVRTAELYFGTNAPELIPPLASLAGVRGYQTQFWRVNEIYDRIAVICNAHPGVDETCEYGGPQRPDMLGTRAYNSHNYRAAIPHYQRWMDSVAAVDWNNDPRISLFQMISERLASAYERFNQYREAAAIRTRMIEVYTRYPSLADTVPFEQLRLAVDFEHSGDMARAEEIYRRVVPLLEGEVRQRQPLLPDGLPPGDCNERVAVELADYYLRRGQRDRARSLLINDCANVSRQIGPSEYATRLLVRARFFDRAGFRDDAVSLYQQVLPIFQQGAGTDSPATAGVLFALSRAALRGGDLRNARAFLGRATDIYRSTLPLIESHTAEEEQRAALDLYSSSLNLAVSLDRDYAPDNPEVRAFAAQVVLERKGRLLESTQAVIAALRRRSTGAAAQALDELARVRAERASLVLPNLLDRAKAPDPARVQLLRSREQELERLAAGFMRGFPPSESVAPQRIGAVLSEGQALVEMITYSPYDAARHASRASRLAAYVFRGDGEVTSVDLGLSNDVATAVAAFRDELSSATTTSREQARALYQLVIAPLDASLAGTRTVFFSPDGDLNLAPLGALVAPDGRYLIERFDVRYVTAGRDLIRPVAPASERSPVVFGDPDYGTPRGSTSSDGRPGEEAFRFRRLESTSVEAENVVAALEGAEIHVGGDATESRLKQVQRPRILHIATHGFFFPDTRSFEDKLAGTTTGTPDDPLVRAGLAMACANAPCNESDDGVLTALEATTLDLEGTELVVLSACDTGVGDAAASDSVYGLRRAFVLAGARQQIASLWPVQGGPASEFMIAFYERMKTKKEAPAEALRALQLEWAIQGPRQHPSYWASFVLFGR